MDNGTEAAPLDQTIAAALSELGVPHSPCRSTSFLIQDGYCTGQRFLFDGIEAIWLIAENVVRFYDEQGRLLKCVDVGLSKEERRDRHPLSSMPSALEPLKHPETDLPNEIDIRWPKVSGDLRGRMPACPLRADRGCAECQWPSSKRQEGWEGYSAVNCHPQSKRPRPADEECSSTRTGTRRGNIMDMGTEADSLHQTIAEALSKLGLPELPCRSTSFLVQDGYCTGQRFLFDGIEAIWLIAENVVRFYDENGRMLKSVGVGPVEQGKAA
jgi:hypothetical protein